MVPLMDGELALGFALALARGLLLRDRLRAPGARGAQGAGRAAPSAPRCSTYLLQRPLWVGATALSLLGWPLQILALAHAPLTLVQPTLALGLLLLLVLGVRILGEHVGPREIAAVVLIIASVGVFAWAAPREPGEVERGAGLVVALAILAVVAVAPVRDRGSAAPPRLPDAAAGRERRRRRRDGRLRRQDRRPGRRREGALLAVVAWAALVARGRAHRA